ncbi:MAG TPA: hypothetical protein VMH24_05295 [Candidatus Sulfotelmatobacter sp.]|nr:hypothetical protein [Candidatus Sulfotelmatobacter sp.]
MLAIGAATLVVAACSAGTAATPPAPTDLMAAISASLATVKQMDARLTLAGTFTPSGADATASGAASPAAPVTLDGTAVEVKSDQATGAADIVVTLPAGLGGGGTSELIATGTDIYLKLGPVGTALGLADDGKYHHTTAAALGGLGGLPMASAEASADPSQVAQAMSALQTFLGGLSEAPTTTAVSCGSATCWDLHVVLTAGDLTRLAAQGASALASAMPFGPLPTSAISSVGSVTLDVIARQDTSRPAEIKAAVDGAAAGSASADLTFTFDTPLAITAPPAEQVVEGFPSLFGP